MKYIKERINKNGKLVRTEITKEEATFYLGENVIADILDNTTAKEMSAAVTVEVDNMWIGVQF